MKNDRLTEARAVVDAARAALTETAQAMRRAMKVATDTQSKVATIERQSAAAQLEQARTLEAVIAGGGSLPKSIDPDTSPALRNAKHYATIASKALALLQDAHAKAQAELAAAERAVIEAVDQIFREEDIESARRVLHHLDAATHLGKALLGITVASELNGHARQPPEVTEALQRLDMPLLDRRHIAINLLKEGDTVAAAPRAARRAALIVGEAVEEATAA